MKKLLTFLREPPQWYINLMFWGSAALVITNVIAIQAIQGLPGSGDLGDLLVANIVVSFVSVIIWWRIDRRRHRADPR